MRKAMAIHAAVLWIVVLAGCAAVGVPAPETFNEKVASAQVAVTGVRRAALDMLKAGQISANDAQNMQDQADVGRKGIDVARKLRATDPQGADARLSATITALQAAQAYLRSKGGNP